MLSLASLVDRCRVIPDPIIEYGHIITLTLNEITTTFRVIVHDESSGADLTIMSLSVSPIQEWGNGYGSHALQLVINWAKSWKLQKIIASNVLYGREHFWIKNGFRRLGHESTDFVFVD